VTGPDAIFRVQEDGTAIVKVRRGLGAIPAVGDMMTAEQGHRRSDWIVRRVIEAEGEYIVFCSRPVDGEL
jgi:hypothetical protein